MDDRPSTEAALYIVLSMTSSSYSYGINIGTSFVIVIVVISHRISLRGC